MSDFYGPMYRAYIEALYLTETGDQDQPPTDAELSDLTKAEARIACIRFMQAAGSGCGYPATFKLEDLNPAQVGHDLWLTRNGHGVGFWDRPEVYGEQLAELFTRISHAMGEHDPEFVN